jgi:hypothetical protein
MKALLILIMGNFIALQSFAAVNLNCSKKEPGADLTYMTELTDLTSSQVGKVSLYFVTQNQKHLFCSSKRPFSVENIGANGKIFKLKGGLLCEDTSAENQVELVLDTQKMTLKVGNNIESCKSF